jgi:hypothetical protein
VRQEFKNCSMECLLTDVLSLVESTLREGVFRAVWPAIGAVWMLELLLGWGALPGGLGTMFAGLAALWIGDVWKNMGRAFATRSYPI